LQFQVVVEKSLQIQVVSAKYNHLKPQKLRRKSTESAAT
jgi:hypothetical protein